MDSPVFLQTKLHPSQVALRCLNRTRLLRELNRDQRARLVMVTGPAGSGKSTLMADFLSQRPHKAAWLGLGEEDQDPQVFLNYFLEALCLTFPGSAEKTRNRYGAAGEMGDLASLSAFFINEIVEYGKPVAIVLDDYHLVDPQPVINGFFKTVLRRGPNNLTLLMTSRDQPDLPLAWLRSKRLLTEVHQENLRFTPQETAELFRDIWNQPLDDDLVSAVVEKTEGWATGLQLVAQAIRHRAPLYHRPARSRLQHLRLPGHRGLRRPARQSPGVSQVYRSAGMFQRRPGPGNAPLHRLGGDGGLSQDLSALSGRP